MTLSECDFGVVPGLQSVDWLPAGPTTKVRQGAVRQAAAVPRRQIDHLEQQPFVAAVKRQMAVAADVRPPFPALAAVSAAAARSPLRRSVKPEAAPSLAVPSLATAPRLQARLARAEVPSALPSVMPPLAGSE